jgi:hypothetical protein
MQLGYAGEAKWCPEASSRGDAKQPGDARAAEWARTGGGGERPPTRSADLDPVSAERLRLRSAGVGGSSTSTQKPGEAISHFLGDLATRWP